MTHASGSNNLRSVTHDRSDDRFVEQNLVPDRKFTPSGDEHFKHSMNSDRFFARDGLAKNSYGGKSNGELGSSRKHEAGTFRSVNFYFPVVEPEFKQGNVMLQIRDYNGKSLILRNNGSIISKHIAKCDESVCGISFTYRVKSRGELRLPCGRPLLVGRGEERILSTLTLNDLWDRKL
ncbi:hypothetical protein TNCV_2532421 [Trichonephila clavipes]|nr:hypothetical protein TNCV_2532421 [Trichonephila clavipes]